jgi:hypothetical protein
MLSTAVLMRDDEIELTAMMAPWKLPEGYSFTVEAPAAKIKDYRRLREQITLN